MSTDQKSEAGTSAKKQAAKITVGLVAAYILAPTLIALSNVNADVGGVFALKLITGIVLFPIVFLVILHFEKKKQQPDVEQLNSSNNELDSKKFSNWNYAGIVLGPLALGLIFVPGYMAGKTNGTFYIGAAFWVVVIFFCSKNFYKRYG